MPPRRLIRMLSLETLQPRYAMYGCWGGSVFTPVSVEDFADGTRLKLDDVSDDIYVAWGKMLTEASPGMGSDGDDLSDLPPAAWAEVTGADGPASPFPELGSRGIEAQLPEKFDSEGGSELSKMIEPSAPVYGPQLPPWWLVLASSRTALLTNGSAENACSGPHFVIGLGATLIHQRGFVGPLMLSPVTFHCSPYYVTLDQTRESN